MLKDFLKEGIHLTPEQVLKIASGEIEYHRPPRSLDEEFAAIEVKLVRPDGSEFTALEGRALQIGLGKKTKANPDFVTFWKNGKMSAALNLRKGFIRFAYHGGSHYIKQELRFHDIVSLLKGFIAVYYSKPRSAHKYHQAGLPSEMCFTREIREGAAAILRLLALAGVDRLAIAYQNQVQVVGSEPTKPDQKPMRRRKGGKC
jgi:hypothetical protein